MAINKILFFVSIMNKIGYTTVEKLCAKVRDLLENWGAIADWLAVKPYK